MQPDPTAPLRRRTLRAATALLVAGSLLAAACGSDDPDDAADGGGAAVEAGGGGNQAATMRNLEGDGEGTPVDGGSLVIGIEGDSDGFNPVTSPWALSGHMVASAIFDPLATYDAAGNVVPHLAESIEPANDDASAWTITVRSGVTFHDETPLTSTEVKAGLDAMRDSVVTSDALAPVTDVAIVDDRTVRVTMDEPWMAFPATLTSQVGYVVPIELTQDLTTLAHPVGTGPFVFESWDEDNEVVVRKNDRYWQEGKPHLDQITFRSIPDHAERLAALRTGEVDVIHTAVPSDIETLRSDDRLKLLEVANGEEEIIMLNVTQPPFDRLEARTALAKATDVERYLRETGHEGVSQPALGPFAEGQLGFREDSGHIGYDLEGAKADVAAYEAATGEPLRFTLTGVNTVEQARIHQVVQAMWAEAGIEVDTDTIPIADVILRAATGDFQALEFRNFGSIDPDIDLQFWRTSPDPEAIVSLNFPRFFDEEIDSQAVLARSSDDEAVRDEAFATIAHRLNTQSPYIWLFRVTWGLAADPRVEGISAGANGTLQTLGAKTWIADLWVE